MLRGCERELIRRQYHPGSKDFSLGPDLECAFDFIKLCVELHPERSFCIDVNTPTPPLLLYSDAEWHGSDQSMGFGWVLFSRDMAYPVCGIGEVPASWASQFVDRKTQIILAEALAALSAFVTAPGLLKNRDLVHFIDNQSSLGAFISGSAGACDLARVAALYQLSAAHLRCRAWLEYVQSSANLSDGPSRLQWKWRWSAIARSLGAKLIPARLPAFDNLKECHLVDLWQQVLPLLE